MCPISDSVWDIKQNSTMKSCSNWNPHRTFYTHKEKSFWFKDNPNHYKSLVNIYKEKTRHEHLNDTERFNILVTLLKIEAKILYNRHFSESNKTIALTRVWRSFRLTYGYHDKKTLMTLNASIFWLLCSRARPKSCIIDTFRNQTNYCFSTGLAQFGTYLWLSW